MKPLTLKISSTSLLLMFGIDSKLKCDPKISLNSSLVSLELLELPKVSEKIFKKKIYFLYTTKIALNK